MKLIRSERTNIYSVRFKTMSGKSVTRGLGTKSLREAKKLVKEAKVEELETASRVNALTRDAIVSITADRNISFEDCIDEWHDFLRSSGHSGNTEYGQTLAVRKFARETGVTLISAVTRGQVFDWVNQDNERNSLNNRKQQLAAMRSLTKYALANNYISKDPTVGVAIDRSKLSHKQKETKERIPYSVKEFRLMHERAPYFFRQAIALGWWTGLRIIDISKLEWDSWSEDHLIVHTEKTDKRVKLPLDNPAIGGGILRKTCAEIDPGHTKYCFPEWAAVASCRTRRSRFSVYFRRIQERMEIALDGKGKTTKSFHCFRHSFVSRLGCEGNESSTEKWLSAIDQIADWVGHSSTKTTKGYLHT